MIDSAVVHERKLRNSCDAFGCGHEPRTCEHYRHRLHGDVLGMQLTEKRALIFTHDLAAKHDQDFRNIDLHRANVVTRPTKGGRVGQGSGVLKALQLRSDDGADRALVNGTVRMTSGLVIYGTRIQT